MPQKRRLLKISDGKNDELYRAAFTQADAAMFVIDSEGVMSAWSAGAAKLFGYDSEEMAGKNIAFLFAEADSASALLWKTSKEKEGRHVFVGLCKIRGGQTVTLAFSSAPLDQVDRVDQAGGMRVFTVRQDGGARLSPEASQDSFPSIPDLTGSLPIILWQADKNGVILRDTGDGLKHFGKKPGSDVGKNVFDLYADFENIISALRRALDGEYVRERVRFAGRVLEAFLGPTRSGAGEVTGMIGVSFDITDSMEAERRDSEIQARAHAIFNMQGHGIIVGSPDRIIVDINDAAAKMLGYARTELIGQNMARIYAADFNEQSELYLTDYLKNHDQTPPVQMEARTKGGAVLPIESVVAAIRKENGDPEYFISSIRDMTEQKRTEAELRRIDQIKGRFIQVVAHQCRTPMSAIQWHLETLLAEEIGPLNEAQQEFIRVMHDKTGDVIDLIGDLLTSIDIEENRLIIESDKVSVDHLVTGVVNQWRTKCEARGIGYLYNEPPAELPPVDADAAKIRKVIQKMVENAINYTPKGGVVEVSVSMAHGAIRVEVKDTGIGIPLSEQSGVFSRFFRASNASLLVTDASGLGLYVAKHLVEKHGGHIGFTSE